MGGTQTLTNSFSKKKNKNKELDDDFFANVKPLLERAFIEQDMSTNSLDFANEMRQTRAYIQARNWFRRKARRVQSLESKLASLQRQFDELTLSHRKLEYYAESLERINDSVVRKEIKNGKI